MRRRGSKGGRPLASYGIVGDLFEVLPALTEEVMSYRARH